jgi:hypothetical protein
MGDSIISIPYKIEILLNGVKVDEITEELNIDYEKLFRETCMGSNSNNVDNINIC